MNLHLILSITFLLLITGCLNLKQPAVKVDYYQIEYELTDSPASEPLDIVLGIRNFTISSAYDHDRIVYKEDTFKRQSYYYHRWITNPSAMIKNVLLKDLQRSGIYRAVTLIPSGIVWDYEIQGHIHEISESDLGENWTAVIDLEVTLIKVLSAKSIRRVLSQKNYRHSAICKKKEPASVVTAMSVAMKELTIELQKDIYKTIRDDSLPEKQMGFQQDSSSPPALRDGSQDTD